MWVLFWVFCLLNSRMVRRWRSTTVEIQVMWLDCLLCLEQEQQNILYLPKWLFSLTLIYRQRALKCPLTAVLRGSGYIYSVWWEGGFQMCCKSWDFSLAVVVTGIVSSINLRDRLSLLHSTEDQDCLQGPHQRSPVLFGLDSVSGCKLMYNILTLKKSHSCVQVVSS